MFCWPYGLGTEDDTFGRPAPERAWPWPRAIAPERINHHLGRWPTGASPLSGSRLPVSPLEDPRNAAHAWARYWRIMRAMAWFTLGVVAAVLAFLFWQNGFVSINFFIATALGIGGMMLLTAALMGLVFLSSGTGHDAAVIDPLADESD
jgi:hypothetical protein